MNSLAMYMLTFQNVIYRQHGEVDMSSHVLDYQKPLWDTLHGNDDIVIVSAGRQSGKDYIARLRALEARRSVIITPNSMMVSAFMYNTSRVLATLHGCSSHTRENFAHVSFYGGHESYISVMIPQYVFGQDLRDTDFICFLECGYMHDTNAYRAVDFVMQHRDPHSLVLFISTPSSRADDVLSRVISRYNDQARMINMSTHVPPVITSMV